jgi:polar amino acid transport system permease protein
MDLSATWNSILTGLPLLAGGLVGTLKLASVSLVASLVIGLVLGMARYGGTRPLRWIAIAYIEVFRNTPVLVQIMWFFFAFPIIAPFDVDPYTAATLALSLNSGAFSAEIFRAGMQSISPGQWDAARGLGMSRLQQVRRIILPQAVRRMIPAFTNRWIELFKLTSLASAIAYPELVYAGKQIANAYYNPVETFTVVALIYIVIVWPISRLIRLVEARLNARG